MRSTSLGLYGLITISTCLAVSPCFAQQPAPAPPDAAQPAPPPPDAAQPAPPPPDVAQPAPPPQPPYVAVQAVADPVAPAPPLSGQKPSGFVFEGSLSTSFFPIDKDLSTSLSSLSGGLLLGYKINRVVFGLGLELTNVGSSSSYEGPDGSGTHDRSSTAYLISPTLQVAVVQSQDQRAELILGGKLGFGSWDTTDTYDPPLDPVPSPDTPEPTHLRVSYRIGPGVRFWAHPSVALSFQSGLSGDHNITDSSESSSSSSSSTRLLSIYASLGVMGVF